MAQINQITKIRLSDGQEVAIVDWSHRVLYSSIDVVSGFTDLELYAFTYVESDLVTASANAVAPLPRRATLEDTNVAQPGQMDATEEMLVYGMATEIYRFQLPGDSVLDEDPAASWFGPVPGVGEVAMLHRRCILELEVSQKAFLQASLGWFVAGFGPNGLQMAGAAPAALAGGTSATNGWPGHNARHTVQIPVHVGGTEKYKVILHNPRGTAVTLRLDSTADDTVPVTEGLSLRINLDVLHKRPTG